MQLAIFASAYCYMCVPTVILLAICVGILLCLCAHTARYASAYYDAGVQLILSRPIVRVLDVSYVSSDEHRCRSRWMRRERSLSRALLPGQDDSFGLSDSDMHIGAF